MLRTGRRYIKSAAIRNKSSAAFPTSEASASVSSSSSTSVPIVPSLLAALAGVGTVSGVAAVVESASSVPAFRPDGQQFSQETFGGRFARMLLACDPRLLLYSEAHIRQCQELLKSHAYLSENSSSSSSSPQRNGGGSTSSRDSSLWEAKRIVDTAVHPDTGELIPRPFRMSGYVPYNGPICVAMVAAQSTPTLLFWSWVNQSQNALVNYYNRNASSPMTNETLLKSYAVAVGSALTVAFGLATFISKRYSAAQAKTMLRWVSFPSAVVASSLNCYIVRSPEIQTGVPLMDAKNRIVADGQTSVEAAKRGVYATTTSRALLQAPVYFLPPLLMSMGPLQRLVSKNKRWTVPLTTYLLLVSFGVGLPAAVAVFPQISEISVHNVENKFQHLRDPETQKTYEVFYYNKGL